MRILLTNDDGIHAPGLRALRDALTRLGDVEVVAPDAEQSGVGLSITYLHPLMARDERRGGEHFGWAVGGSPADCVKLGVLEFCEGRPDLVVSGINAGANVGINVLYSGTVAGAIEGAFFGVTSVAVSAAARNTPDYPRIAGMAVDLIAQILGSGASPGSLWNVNFPESQPGWPLGVKPVAMGVRRQGELIEKRIDPRGRPYYWSGLDPHEEHATEPGTDRRELADGYVTVTPLHFDLTNAAALGGLHGVQWQIDGEFREGTG